MVDPGWLGGQLKEHPEALAHEELEESDRIVLTASTAELQKFVIEHADNEEAWDDCGTLERVLVPEPAAGEPSEGPGVE